MPARSSHHWRTKLPMAMGTSASPCLECAVSERELEPREESTATIPNLAESDDQRRDVAVAERRDGEQPYVHQCPRRIGAAGEHGLTVGERNRATERREPAPPEPATVRWTMKDRTGSKGSFVVSHPYVRPLDEAEGQQAEPGDGTVLLRWPSMRPAGAGVRAR